MQQTQSSLFSDVCPSHCPVPVRRDNNFIKDFPQLADGLMVIPLPVEEQCRGVLSEPFPNLQLLTGITLTHHRVQRKASNCFEILGVFFFSSLWLNHISF